MLNASDILEGASAPADPNVFVVGAFDSRITFFSQQVRGLELAHALKEQGRLTAGMRCAVVGGGAAGVAAAAALALLEPVQVVLFETANEVLSLQSASERRRLDPHIFDWPAHNTPDPVAGLPILDWRAGPARAVRNEVKTEFEVIVGKAAGRLEVRTRHTVKAATPDGRGLRLDFDQLPAGAPPRARSEMFDLVILAFGFGLESGVAGYASLPTYWEDGGVPGVEFTGRPEPRFLVSGDGDGALIDLVAAASAAFSHAGMLELVTASPGVDRIIPMVEAIDREGRDALRQGLAYDYHAAYDDRVFPLLEQIGLPARFEAGLRPGVHVTLQTLSPDPFNAKTATLNRLAAFLVAKTCGDRFVHVHGELTPVPAPAGPPHDAVHWFTCNGIEIGVHTAIIRHGPNRTAVRNPFAPLLEGFEEKHRSWVEKHGREALVPKLSAAARSAYEIAAQQTELPLACWRIVDIGDAVPLRIALQTDAAQVVWSGDLTLDHAADLWDGSARRVTLFAPPLPQEMPLVANAALRLAVHGGQIAMKCNVGHWRAWAEQRTSNSPHGRNIRIPPMSAGAPEGVGQHAHAAPDAELAARLNSVLDLWMLNTMDASLTRYIDSGVDEGTVVTIRAPKTLRDAMQVVWLDWRARFRADPDLLDRFLRLMICAQDNADSAREARILVGPLKLTDITRATAVALMVAASWTSVTPSGAAPGNLALTRPTGGWTGHACGADLIDRQPTALQAGRFIWRTNFVVLPLTDSPVEVTRIAEASLAETAGFPLSLSDAGQPNFILTTDPAFRVAAETSLAALAAHLSVAEGTHFQKLRAAVEVKA